MKSSTNCTVRSRALVRHHAIVAPPWLVNVSQETKIWKGSRPKDKMVKVNGIMSHVSSLLSFPLSPLLSSLSSPLSSPLLFSPLSCLLSHVFRWLEAGYIRLWVLASNGWQKLKLINSSVSQDILFPAYQVLWMTQWRDNIQTMLNFVLWTFFTLNFIFLIYISDHI